MQGQVRFAVDLGTSNTVAVVDRGDGTPRPLLFDGNPLLPSAVFADASGTVFVGRDADFGVVVGQLLDAVESGEPRTVLLSGEAGVGKTRLAQELGRFTGELPGARVLWGRCAPYGEGRVLAAERFNFARYIDGLEELFGRLTTRATPGEVLA